MTIMCRENGRIFSVSVKNPVCFTSNDARASCLRSKVSASNGDFPDSAPVREHHKHYLSDLTHILTDLPNRERPERLGANQVRGRISGTEYR